MGERTGSRVFQWVWSYVLIYSECGVYQARRLGQVEILWGLSARPVFFLVVEDTA
ncbi:hypothetical protein B0T09DRAFT_352129 [Sordaria sp. MPI-SDFR-AT-0083]|nr:hypothetical protein B0T09DRAFT_352129 [Sordaria sp. MPI-SDFR-AT-0083]